MSNENKDKKKLVKGRHLSAIKRARQSKRLATRNTGRKSQVKTFEKKVIKALQDKDLKAAQAALQIFMSEADRAAQKGIIHFRKAARRIGSLSRQISGLGK